MPSVGIAGKAVAFTQSSLAGGGGGVPHCTNLYRKLVLVPHKLFVLLYTLTFPVRVAVQLTGVVPEA